MCIRDSCSNTEAIDLNYKSIQSTGRALAGLFGLDARELELHVPVAFLDRRLQQAAKRVQQHRIEAQRDALAVGRMQGDHRLAAAIVAVWMLSLIHISEPT